MKTLKPGTIASEKFVTPSEPREVRYLVYLPENHAADGTNRWPLLLFLHGAGERGTDLRKVAVHGPLKLVNAGRKFPFVIVAPQCPAGQRWHAGALATLLDHVTERFNADPDRVYVAGLSMGGYGTWELVVNEPQRLAAAVPICGGGNLIDIITVTTPEKSRALKQLPIQVFHGAKDTVVPLSESERTVNYLRGWGCTNIHFTVYPEAQHDSWTTTFNNPDLYEWLLKQKRK